MNTKLEQKNLDIQNNLDCLRNDLKNCSVDAQITSLDLTQLEHQLQHEQLQPITVLQSYQAKALQLHDNGNSGICEFIREANQQALDLALSQNRDKLLLYGIPISLNELCAVRGYDSTFSLIKRCLDPNSADCVLVQVLRSLGAIPFVLTTTSQAALHTSGYSPIFQHCFNPHSRDHDPGGSTCGEGVILSLYGSPTGFGTDIAGSIRVTASFCGLCALKPTSNRISNRGLAQLDNSSVLNLHLQNCVAPMGRKTTDLVVVMRALLHPTSNMFLLDPYVPPLYFNDTAYKGLDRAKLRIGFYDTLNSPDLLQTVPSIRRAVREAVAVLQKLGHQVIEFRPPRPDYAFKLALKLLNASGTQVRMSILQDEPLDEHTTSVYRALKMPDFVRRFADWLTSRTFGRPAALASTLSGPGNLDNAIRLLDEAQSYCSEFQEAWDSGESLDALVCPVQATPAPHKSTPVHVSGPSNAYSILYNLLDYPAGSIQISRVTAKDIQEAHDWCQNATLTSIQREILQMQETTKDLPTGIQVVAKPYQEEIALRLMRELERELHSS